jgi:hypothetical protein
MRNLFTLAIILVGFNSFSQTYTYTDPNPILEKEKKDKEAFFQKRKDNATRLGWECTQTCLKMNIPYSTDANNGGDKCKSPNEKAKCLCACETRQNDSLTKISQQEKAWRLDIIKREEEYKNRKVKEQQQSKVENKSEGQFGKKQNYNSNGNSPYSKSTEPIQQINQNIQDIGNAIIAESNKKYQAEKAQQAKEDEEYYRIKEQANHPLKFEGNNNSIFLIYDDATGDISLSKNGNIDNDVLFNTMEYNNSRMLVAFKMSEAKVYFSASGINVGKTYLTELKNQGATLLLYFVSDKLNGKTSPPYTYFNFNNGTYVFSKEESPFFIDSWYSKFDSFRKRSDEIYLIRNNSDGSLKFENKK